MRFPETSSGRISGYGGAFPKALRLPKNRPPITIECLFAPGCDARNDTLALVDKVTGELGLSVNVQEGVVSTPEEALAVRFLGSPSIRVNGRDIEAGADERTDFGMG